MLAEPLRGRLKQMSERSSSIEGLLASEDVLKHPKKLEELTRELSGLKATTIAYLDYLKLEKELSEARQLLEAEAKDSEMTEMYQEEIESLEQRVVDLEAHIEKLIFDNQDPDRDKPAIMEIRAGTGGDEAALFVGDLYRMYGRFCADHGLKVETLSAHETGLGGFKEIVFSVTGEAAFRYMKHESGTHRVQRVPDTEASGRIHTSAVTVAVMPEAEAVEVDIDPGDLRIDVYRSSGPGGQSVNTTDSAVRVTHVPTGLVVCCQDEKSQLKNKTKALRILRTRLLAKIKEDLDSIRASTRKSQIGTGDRSEKIRTYNFPDRRATDHRVGLTLYSLDQVMEGDLEPFIRALEEFDKQKFFESQALKDS